MIIFYDDVKKTDPSKAALDALQQLRDFLDKNEPQLVKFLMNLWRNEGRALTYKEIREAIIAGDLDETLLYAWQRDYSKFVVQYVAPAWQTALLAAAAELETKYPAFHFDAMNAGIRRWSNTMSARFVTNSSAEQILAIREVVKKAAQLGDFSVDELSRVIRPMVGLTRDQAAANLRLYQKLRANGMGHKRALDKCIRYAARQHRYRAYNIARTELSFAYNKGALEGVQQAQEMGLMGKVVKVWSTAADEQVCPVCGALDGVQIEMEEEFDFYTKLQHRYPTIKRTPPAHPSCRCGMVYKEIEPPKFTE